MMFDDDLLRRAYGKYRRVNCAMETENARLVAENERLQRVVEQATAHMAIEDDDIVIRSDVWNWYKVVGYKTKTPDLFAQLKEADQKRTPPAKT